MAGYEEHPSKATSWRGGRFVVLPEGESANCTVWFVVEEDSAGVHWEGLLATGLSEDRACISAVPFWLYDLNLGDEVAVIESAERAPVATGVVRDGGNYVFRVIFEGAEYDDYRWQSLMIELEPHDCWFDVRSPSFVALSAPPAQARAVGDYLLAREQCGDLRFETGRSQSGAG